MLPFNANGPKTIDPETFKIYQSLLPARSPRWNIDELFYYAINEGNPSDLRLLAWRDILFQPGSVPHPEVYPCYHVTGEYYGRVLHINFPGGNGNQTGFTLREAIRYRPQLAEDFAEQLYYNLDHDLIYPKRSHPNAGTDNCDSLIELFLPFVSEDLQRRLWSYHSYSTIYPESAFQAYCRYTWLCLPHVGMPEWLVQKLWLELKTTAKAECDQLTAQAKSRYVLVYEDHNTTARQHQYPATAAFMHRLSLLDPQKSNDITIVRQYINALYHLLPAHVLYLDLSDLGRFLPYLHDETLTFRILQRHLHPLLNPDLAKTARAYTDDYENFLFWASGFTNLCRLRPLHHDALQNLGKAIATLHADAKASGEILLY